VFGFKTALRIGSKFVRPFLEAKEQQQFPDYLTIPFYSDRDGKYKATFFIESLIKAQPGEENGGPTAAFFLSTSSNIGLTIEPQVGFVLAGSSQQI
jgi:hypothetical protein